MLYLHLNIKLCKKFQPIVKSYCTNGFKLNERNNKATRVKVGLIL